MHSLEYSSIARSKIAPDEFRRPRIQCAIKISLTFVHGNQSLNVLLLSLLLLLLLRRLLLLRLLALNLRHPLELDLTPAIRHNCRAAAVIVGIAPVRVAGMMMNRPAVPRSQGRGTTQGGTLASPSSAVGQRWIPPRLISAAARTAMGRGDGRISTMIASIRRRTLAGTGLPSFLD